MGMAGGETETSGQWRRGAGQNRGALAERDDDDVVLDRRPLARGRGGVIRRNVIASDGESNMRIYGTDPFLTPFGTDPFYEHKHV